MYINIAVGLVHKVLFTDFDHDTYQWRYELFYQSGYFHIGPPHDQCWPLTIDLKPGFYIVVSGLWRSLLNLKILQRPIITLKDSQRLGRWDRLVVYLSDRERPRTTLSFHLCHMETTQNTFGDRQPPWKTANDWQWVSLAPKVVI